MVLQSATYQGGGEWGGKYGGRRTVSDGGREGEGRVRRLCPNPLSRAGGVKEPKLSSLGRRDTQAEGNPGMAVLARVFVNTSTGASS